MFYNINTQKTCIYICISKTYMQEFERKRPFETFRKFGPLFKLLHERIYNLLHV